MQMKHQFEDIHDFRRLKYIGSRSSSAIYTVEDKKSGNVYAAKCLHRWVNKYQSEMENDKSNLEQLRVPHEFPIMFHLSHPAILKVYGLSHLDFDDEPNPIIILEYMPNSSLNDIQN